MEKEIVIDEPAGMWIALAICGINSENMILWHPLHLFSLESLISETINYWKN